MTPLAHDVGDDTGQSDRGEHEGGSRKHTERNEVESAQQALDGGVGQSPDSVGRDVPVDGDDGTSNRSDKRARIGIGAHHEARLIRRVDRERQVHDVQRRSSGRGENRIADDSDDFDVEALAEVRSARNLLADLQPLAERVAPWPEKCREMRIHNGDASRRDRKSTRLNSSHHVVSRMPSSA